MLANLDINSVVINLDIRTERLKKFMSQPAIKTLQVERLPATYWKDIEIPDAWLQLNRGPGGGYATTISHRNAVLKAKENNYPNILIFEDDAVVPSWFPQELARFLDHLPEDWDMVFFGGVHEREPWPRCFPRHVSGPVYKGFRTELLECYMVNAKAYDYVINMHNEVLKYPEGWPTFGLLQQVLNFYVPLNLPITQPLGWGQSDNWNETVNLDWLKNRALIEGWFSDQEGLQYLTECMAFPGEIIVELGTWMGRSTSWVAEWIHSHEGKLYCVDLWQAWERGNDRTPWQDFEWYMWKTNLLDSINVLKKDTVAAAEEFDDESVALVMFDADHSREQLTKELKAWIPKVKPGGILCGHDYNNPSHPDVTQVVNQFFGKPDRVKDWFWVVEKNHS